MDSLNLLPQEETFDVRPVGVRYRCEFCNEGEMIASSDLTVTLNAKLQSDHHIMIPHSCIKCGKTMMLPRTYPRVEFVPIEKIEHIVYPKRYFVWPYGSVPVMQFVMMRKEFEVLDISHKFPQLTYDEIEKIIRKLEDVKLIWKNIANGFYNVAQWSYNEIPVDVLEEFQTNGVSLRDIQELLRKRDIMKNEEN